tara:strand:+ start:443 stop:961 length:519 start_codon:yes stop_codon:yes gene_type:complete
MEKSDTIMELLKALSVFQGELENVEKAKAGHGYKYATLGHCIDAAKSMLAKNGLSVVQLMGNNDKGDNTMQTVLGHSSGEYISSMCVIPIAKLQGGGGSNPAQIMGASITYMRRYQYAAIIGLAQDDTDGVPKAKERKPTNDELSWVTAINAGNATIDDIHKDNKDYIRSLL